MTPPPGQSGSNPLPQKEQALFKKIVKSYEHKQYKNGLKFAKQILSNSKYSEHGETLAMKGLILNCMGKTKEAHEIVKLGLKNDLKSHVCWHVFGLLQRADKNYDGAIKAYHNALKLDKDNMQILRDLSLLQVQLRDIEGYKDTRYRLLVLRPTQRASWIGYAMAYHLLKDYNMALKILREFAKTLTPGDYDFEYSELLLYINMVLREAEKYQEALDHLEENCALIADKLNYHETRAKIFIKLGRLPDAAAIYESLIDRNPENHAYYRGVEECRLLIGDPNDEILMEKRLEIYENAIKSNPRASVCKRLPLTFLKGARFLEKLKPYLIHGLRKGIPSLFQNVRCLYDDPAKAVVIERMLLSFAKNLDDSDRFTNDVDDDSVESPTTILWVCLFLAQHYDRLGDINNALEYIDKALAHTPTLIELLVVKAKILKHAGNHIEAVRYMDQAQAMDTADRYINSKCGKYMLRAGMVHEAEIMCGKFTREGVNPMQNLYEMQCMWFETECAKAYKNTGRLGDSLKKCHEVERHFTGIIEDQFDFHTYCVRKMTLCAYVALLRLEDVLKKHRFYYKPAKLAVKIYLGLYDEPYDPSGISGLNANKLTASELRKEIRKQKKKDARSEADRQKQLQQQAQNQKNKPDPDLENTPQEFLDPNTLLKTETPLDEAVKFIIPLINLNCDQVDVYELGFEIYYRKDNKQILEDGPVREIVDEVMEEIFDTKDAKEMNEKFKLKNQHSPMHRIAVGQACHLLGTETTDFILKYILQSLADKNVQLKDWKLHKHFLKLISRGSFGTVKAHTIEEYRTNFAKKFPNAICFRPIISIDNQQNGQPPYKVAEDGVEE